MLEQRYGQRTTAVRAESLGRAELPDYEVIVFPSGRYGAVGGEGLVERLRAWMRDGGTLITLAESSRWAASDDAGLLATATERRGGRAAGEPPPVVDGSRVFRPIPLDRGTNVGRYGGLDDLVLGGIVWDEARPQLAHKAFLIHQRVGRGQLVAFAEGPNYRAYTEATQLLFMNAVLLGPGR